MFCYKYSPEYRYIVSTIKTGMAVSTLTIPVLTLWCPLILVFTGINPNHSGTNPYYIGINPYFTGRNPYYTGINRYYTGINYYYTGIIPLITVDTVITGIRFCFNIGHSRLSECCIIMIYFATIYHACFIFHT